ncbi:MAG: acetolactate synthase, partial [Christensenella sp.]|uniref:acetolactate synthase n=1 Tax=Christensenella sp. TaxID=1935934 RepID=UPI002B21542A
MTVKQISVFLENNAGQLAELTKVLDQNGIDMRALSVAETRDFGILRLIVDDSYKTATVLKDAGYICSITPVLAVAIPDEPGGLHKVLTILGDNKINLEYTYA